MAAFLWDRKLLLCSVTSSPRIALAILAKQSAGFAFCLQFCIRPVMIDLNCTPCQGHFFNLF